jgi:hypothetical protein
MDKKAFFYNFIFMFISPALSLAHGLRGNFGPEFKRRLLIVFITIYGSIITISENQDGNDHLNRVYLHYIDLPFTQFMLEIGDILTFKINPDINQDLYIHLLSYFTGTIVGLPSLFFVFVSFVYAYFFAGSMMKIFYYTQKKYKYSWTFYIFAIVFVLWKSLDGINTVRTWTGMWILFYACLSYYQTKKVKYILLMFVPPLVHFAYFMMAIPAWIVLLLGVRHKLYIVIFALSFVSVLINPQSLNHELEKTEVGANKVQGYSVDQKISSSEIIERRAGRGDPFYGILYSVGLQTWAVSFVALILIVFLVYRNGMTPLESSLFSIGILTQAFSNSTWFLYSLGNRSGIVACLFLLASVVLLLKRDYLQAISIEKHKALKFFLNIAGISLIPFILYEIAFITNFVSVYLVALPFVPWFTSDWNYSINEFLKLFI